MLKTKAKRFKLNIKFVKIETSLTKQNKYISVILKDSSYLETSKCMHLMNSIKPSV